MRKKLILFVAIVVQTGLSLAKISFDAEPIEKISKKHEVSFVFIENTEDNTVCWAPAAEGLILENMQQVESSLPQGLEGISPCSFVFLEKISYELENFEADKTVDVASPLFGVYLAGVCALSAGVTYYSESFLKGTGAGTAGGLASGLAISKVLAKGARLSSSTAPVLGLTSLATATLCSGATKLVISWWSKGR